MGQAGGGWAWGWSGEEPPELGPTEGDWQPLQWWTQAWVPECQVCGRNYAPHAIAPSYFKCRTVPLAACLFFFSRPGLTQLLVSKLKLGLGFLPVSVKAPEISMGKVSCALVPLHSCVRNLTYYHSPWPYPIFTHRSSAHSSSFFLVLSVCSVLYLEGRENGWGKRL